MILTRDSDIFQFASPSVKTEGFVTTTEVEMEPDWPFVHDRAELELAEKHDTCLA